MSSSTPLSLSSYQQAFGADLRKEYIVRNSGHAAVFAGIRCYCCLINDMRKIILAKLGTCPYVATRNMLPVRNINF